MDVEFATNRLRRAYEEQGRAQRLWGTDVARKYVLRVEVLYAVPEFADLRALRAFRAHELEGSRSGEWSIDLTDRWRLIVIPSGSGAGVTVQEVTNHYE